MISINAILISDYISGLKMLPYRVTTILAEIHRVEFI
jgi:hypothetical protein